MSAGHDGPLKGRLATMFYSKTSQPRSLLIGALACLALTATEAPAQSVDFMQNECSSVAQTFYRDFTAATEMQYNGRRVDGTHAINGRIYLETRAADFACSYNSSGRRMVEFVAEGRKQNGFLPGGNAGGTGGATGVDAAIVRVTGLSAGDVLNVRSGPGTGFRIIGALANGDRVKRLRCENPGGATWCLIEMQTDMREQGWVSARYLSRGVASDGGTATQLPEPPGPAATTTARIRFPAGETGVQFNESLKGNSVRRYLLGARKGQFLFFNLGSSSSSVTWRILNPDGSLMDRGPASKGYQGQLWQSGDHVIEITNSGDRTRTYQVILGVKR
ncbi:SH3 domain-containing protein [Albidovulum sediminis]|uniref:SH3 domain-containing protein n=1 Tax=Albidovulum sediminis TaxID=3066345 RepID=A0ABT2NKD5_9RHOB|nr:SH3 domain-containing protein [Defluviimonas sediminis]MCT8329364.1 SH3 domain-containing protein [Defluviimonas sediminis]